MAKKRKLAQNNSTPTSEPEPETQSQPETEPIEEDQPPIKEEELEPEEDEQEEEEAEDEEADDDDGEDPQTLENPNPTSDPAASNGDGAASNGDGAASNGDGAASNGDGAAGDEEEDSDPESLHKILELFSKDQLVDLLRDSAGRHADVRMEIHRLADVDPALRKIFVHGLGWDTSAKVLTDVFSQYGEIEDCNAVTDKATGKSKGYAFILFKHRKGAQNALREPQKKIGNRMTACQLASAGPVPGPQHAALAPAPAAAPVSEYTLRKIFVSNVGADIDPQKLFEFFAKFGDIEEGPLGLDKATGKPRGFCLFVYKTIESARKVLEEPHKNFEGHVLHCQKAIDGPKNKPGFQFQHQHGAGAQYPGGGQKGNFSGGVRSHIPAVAGGHLMAPPATGLGYQAAAAMGGGAGQPMASVAGLNPVVNQALTALLLGGLGSAVNQGVPGQMGNTGTQGGYGYGGQAQVQGGYGGAQMGQGGGAHGQQGYGQPGGGPPYMGHH